MAVIDRPDELLSGIELESIVERAISDLGAGVSRGADSEGRPRTSATKDRRHHRTRRRNGEEAESIGAHQLKERRACLRGENRMNRTERRRRPAPTTPSRRECGPSCAAAKIRRPQEIDLLPGVQRRIRERSRGRFYADGWSRRGSPTSTYVVTSLLMLVILTLVYFVLVPHFRVP